MNSKPKASINGSLNPSVPGITSPTGVRRRLSHQVSLSVVMFVCGCMQADGDEVHAVSAEAALDLQSGEEAELADLEALAKAKGWTIEQASQHREAADAVGRVAERLATVRPEIFVGSLVPEDPAAEPAVWIKGLADEDVYEILAEEAHPVALIENQPYSFEELMERQGLILAELKAAGFTEIGATSGIKTNGRIQVTIARRPDLPDSAETLVALLPEELRDTDVRVIDGPVGRPENYSAGGMRMLIGSTPWCTAGWPVTEISPPSRTGVTSASHCNNQNGIDHFGSTTHSTTFQYGHIGPWGDVEWHTTSANEINAFKATPGQLRSVTAVEENHHLSVGESVCIFRSTVNQYFCDTIDDVSVACIDAQRLALMDNDNTIGGDSGASWYWGQRAYGSHVGDCWGANVWSKAANFFSAIGVVVLVN